MTVNDNGYLELGGQSVTIGGLSDGGVDNTGKIGSVFAGASLTLAVASSTTQNFSGTVQDWPHSPSSTDYQGWDEIGGFYTLVRYTAMSGGHWKEGSTIVSGSLALVMNGGGAEDFSGTNSYSGGTTISTGTLQLAAR